MVGDRGAIADIVRGGPEEAPVREVWRLADRRLAEGDARFLADLGLAVHHRYGGEDRYSPNGRWRGSIVHHLVGRLCLAPGADRLGEALRLLAGLASPESDRRGAELFAQARAPAELDAVFDASAVSSELRACLVQELVLRTVPLDELPRLVRWTGTAVWRQHPLAWLPLWLTPLEVGVELPFYHADGGAKSSSLGPSAPPAVAADLALPVPVAREVDPAPAEATVGLFDKWARTEARTFRLSSPPDARAVAALLASLPLECLRGLDSQTRFAVTRSRVAEAWNQLFDAACTGGAYSGRREGAYSRLMAWRCLAALCGATRSAPAQEVVETALEVEWYRFNAATDWFEQVAWDLGLAGLGPGRTLLTVLAATDTD